jgi:hypothetical protein
MASATVSQQSVDPDKGLKNTLQLENVSFSAFSNPQPRYLQLLANVIDSRRRNAML